VRKRGAPYRDRARQLRRYAAVTGTQLIEQLLQSRERLKGVRSDAAAWRILPTLLGQPAVNVKYLKHALGLGEMAALRALDLMVQRGVLEERTGMTRNRIWQHAGIFEVLDACAKKIRRTSAR
jgi:hypothetical protein